MPFNKPIDLAALKTSIVQTWGWAVAADQFNTNPGLQLAVGLMSETMGRLANAQHLVNYLRRKHQGQEFAKLKLFYKAYDLGRVKNQSDGDLDILFQDAGQIDTRSTQIKTLYNAYMGQMIPSHQAGVDPPNRKADANHPDFFSRSANGGWDDRRAVVYGNRQHFLLDKHNGNYIEWYLHETTGDRMKYKRFISCRGLKTVWYTDGGTHFNPATMAAPNVQDNPDDAAAVWFINLDPGLAGTDREVCWRPWNKGDNTLVRAV